MGYGRDMNEPDNPQQPPPEGYGNQPAAPQGQSYNPPPAQGQRYDAPPGGRPVEEPRTEGRYAAGAPGTAAGTTAYSRGRLNVVALVLAIISAVLGILSLFVLAWYRKNYNSFSGGAGTTQKSTFPKIHDTLSQAQQAIDSQPSVGKYIHLGIAPTYFGWLGYVLIAAAVVLAIISALPLGGAVVAVKFVSALVALAGLAATFWAIDLINVDAQLRSQVGSAGGGYTYWLKHTSFGAWAMMLAFLLCFIASLLPPKRRVVVEPAAAAGRY